jgi:predicted O-linked N-acetylglucosamine transferase (SPINDLY family)
MNLEKNFKVFLDLLNSNKLDECLSRLEIEKKIFLSPLYENLYGIILAKKNLIEDAKVQFLSTIKKYPDFPDAYFNLGTIFFNQEKYLDAENLLIKSIKLRDGYYEAILYLGNLYRKTYKFDKAISLFNDCKKIYDQDPELYNSLGLCYQKKRNYKLAIDYFNIAIKIKPDAYQIYNNLALVYFELKKFSEALNFFDRAIEMNPNFAEAYYNIGNIYRETKRYVKAKANYEKALSINKYFYQCYYNLARVKIDEGRGYFEAIEDLKYCLNLNDRYLVAHSLLGITYLDIFDFEKSIYHLEKSIENISAQESIPAEDIQTILQIYLFHLNYFYKFDNNIYFKIADKLHESYSLKLNNFINSKNNSPIKIGFFSGDFMSHPVGFQVIGLIKHLSKDSNFQILGYYNELNEDKLTLEFKKNFFKWTNLFTAENDIIDLIRSDELDIAIDLSGHTLGNSLNIFSNRIAEIQITWCGYLNSSGIKNMDYILGDKFVFYEGDKNLYTEKQLKLANCWSHLEINDQIKVNELLPAIQNKFITFGCFNNLRKLNNELILAWSKILLSVTNSKLYLKNKNFINEDYTNFLKKIFETHGIDSKRLIFERDSKRNELLSSYNKVDIALDTYPYNGGTTTLEAYSMCVPVLTLVGERFISRCGYSINANLGLNEWSCFSYDEYIEKGIYFAKNIKLLEQVKKNLIENRKKTPVFNSELFTKDFIDTIKTVLN